mgnify:CR=1 FL=1
MRIKSRAACALVNGVESELGIALLIVLFVVALASVVVLDLTFSTFIQSRTLGMIERQLQAEYILKSLVNFSAAVIAQDSDPKTDSFKEPWGIFRDCVQVPRSIAVAFGIVDPAVKIYLEISPDNMKLPLHYITPVRPGSGSAISWHEPLARLFEDLGFDKLSKTRSETERNNGDGYDSKQLVSNLYDYLDSDFEPNSPGPGFPKGIELPLEEGVEDAAAHAPHKRITRVEQLAEVPGFTAKHIQLAKPYLTVNGDGQINVNVASKRILGTLPQLADYAQRIVEIRDGEDGPFNEVSDLSRADVPIEAQNAARPFLRPTSNSFEIIAKVEYGNQASFFASAQLARFGSALNETPAIKSLVLY